MRWLLLAAGVLLGGHDALAQQLPVVEKPITLSLTDEQTKLVVQTLGAIGCQNVTQLVMCLEAAKLRAEIQLQAREQVK